MPDIARDPLYIKRRHWRRVGFGAAMVVAAIVVSVGVGRMEPAPPSVEADTLLRDTVKRGSIVRQVRGVGTLVPEDTRWIPADTDGRVERILLRPGAHVHADTILLELSNPQVQQEAINARLQLQSAEAHLENLRVQFDNELLTQEAQVAALEADFEQARMDADTNDALAKRQLVSELLRRQSQLRANSLMRRLELENKRLASARESVGARLRVQRAVVEQMRALLQLHDTRLASLRVRAGFAGVLQQVPVEVGQRVGPGMNLARVADPGRLKAELRIPETQARDIDVGQAADIDTRNGIISGIVSRKDPAAANGTVTVDVTLSGSLPRGAVPDLTIDGTIQLERLDNVLYVGRPSFGHEQTTATLFRLSPDKREAERVQVKLGRSSVNTIEVVAGLREGDDVLLSDMSAVDGFDKVRLR